MDLSPEEAHAAKQTVRRRVWEYMEDHDIARFPRPVFDRIPNFVGARTAAERATRIAAWRRADIVKANPDAPQAPLRELGLREGKLLYMAVPRLRTVRPFLALDPKRVNPSVAASIRGAAAQGKAVAVAEMKPVDLVIAGSVAVNRRGARIGKGGGYSDLEFGLAREAGLVREETPVLTTVHACQVLEEDLPMLAHDEPVDWIATPLETIRTERAFRKPMGVYWHLLSGKQLAAIPVLTKLRSTGKGANR